MRRLILLVAIFSLPALGQSPKPFRLQDLTQYLKADNPFYYRAVGEKFIAKSAADAANGVTDLQLHAAYDDKRYAVSKGDFQSVTLTQNLLNGLSFQAGFRRAQGLQEYNNIKTGNDGEIVAGVKFSLFSLINDMSQNRVTVEQAKLNHLKSEDHALLKLLNLKFNMAKLYFQVRLRYSNVLLEKALLEKAKKHQRFIAKKIKSGVLPQSASVEIEQMILQRKERVVQAQNDFLQTRNLFVQYLGISLHTFKRQYRIEALKPIMLSLPSKTLVLNDALSSRPELDIYDKNRAQIRVNERFNELSARGEMTIGFTGNYDLLYKEGYKTSLNFAMPLQRTAYKGNKEKLRLQQLLNQSERLAWIEELRANIANVYVAHRQLQEAIRLLRHQLQKSQELEKIEKRKLDEGVGSLIFLNQREMMTLQIRQQLMQYYLKLQINELTLQYYRNAFSF
ncbi:MAG: TolC family protein [Sulfurovum sp.]|nr:TolC family protein [Sulfurovum sp.]